MVAYRSASSAEGDTGTTLSVTKPAGTAENDVLLALQKAPTLAEMTTPAGGSTWELLDDQTSNNIISIAGKLWIKQAGASEPANYTFNKGSGNTTHVVMVAVESGSRDVVFASLNTGSGDAANTPGVDPEGTADLEVRFVGGEVGV